jgi:hypothetical protein
MTALLTRTPSCSPHMSGLARSWPPLCAWRRSRRCAASRKSAGARRRRRSGRGKRSGESWVRAGVDGGAFFWEGGWVGRWRKTMQHKVVEEGTPNHIFSCAFNACLCFDRPEWHVCMPVQRRACACACPPHCGSWEAPCWASAHLPQCLLLSLSIERERGRERARGTRTR